MSKNILRTDNIISSEKWENIDKMLKFEHGCVRADSLIDWENGMIDVKFIDSNSIMWFSSYPKSIMENDCSDEQRQLIVNNRKQNRINRYNEKFGYNI